MNRKGGEKYKNLVRYSVISDDSKYIKLKLIEIEGEICKFSYN